MTFLLLMVITQVGMATAMRSAADAAVTASARRAAIDGADVTAEERRLAESIAAIVPGAHGVDAEIRISSSTATAAARFRWMPPGPMLTPLDIRVRARVPRVVEP